MRKNFQTIVTKAVMEAADVLWSGQLVAVPTETVYGLAGNALDPAAVARIFATKQRPSFDPLIIHVPDLGAARSYVEDIPGPLLKLAKAYWPGPLTLLLPRRKLIPDLVTAGLNRVAVRVPSHPLMLELLKELDFPLAAPSANPFGYISPTQPSHVLDQLGGDIPLVLDGGPCKVGVESTIVAYDEGEVVIYRKGGLAIEQIEAVVGAVKVRTHSSSNPAAPGMLKSHYAPRKPLIVVEQGGLLTENTNTDIAYLTFQQRLPEHIIQRQLSPLGDLTEAAQRLFAYLRELDAAPVKSIVAELLPEHGLGRAINDRLRRAAAQ